MQSKKATQPILIESSDNPALVGTTLKKNGDSSAMCTPATSALKSVVKDCDGRLLALGANL